MTITIQLWHIWLAAKVVAGLYLTILHKRDIIDTRFYPVAIRGTITYFLLNPELAIMKAGVLAVLWMFFGPRTCSPSVCRRLLSLPSKKYECPLCEDVGVVYRPNQQVCECRRNPHWQAELERRKEYDVSRNRCEFTGPR